MSDTITEMEREASANRTLLADTLSQIGNALSPQQITQSVSREVQEHGGAVGKTALNIARANPTGALLVGLGVAALAVGPKRPKTEPPYDTRTRPTAKGFSDNDPLTSEFDARVAAAGAASSEPKAPKLRAALMNGLAQLPEPARIRVIKAREAAIEPQEKLDRKAAIAKHKAESFHRQQPLATGVLAVGLGALFAAALPRTKAEDDLMGEQRDRLMQQAEFVLRDEMAKARQTGEAALRDSLDAGKERLQQRH